MYGQNDDLETIKRKRRNKSQASNQRLHQSSSLTSEKAKVDVSNEMVTTFNNAQRTTRSLSKTDNQIHGEQVGTIDTNMRRNILTMNAMKLTPLVLKSELEENDNNIDITRNERELTVSAMDITRNGTVLILDYLGTLMVFSKDCKLISTLFLTQRLLGIALIRDKTAAVSSADEKLYFVDISETASPSLEKTIYLEYLINCMTEYNGSLIIATFARPSYHIKMIDTNGQEIWSVPEKNYVSVEPMFDSPRGLATAIIAGKPTVIIADVGLGKLTFLNPNNGDVLKTDINTEWIDPYGVTTDKYGNFYVALYNQGQIKVWSPDLKKSRTLLQKSDLSKVPMLVLYNDVTNELLVSYEKTNFVDRFKLFDR